LKISLAEAARRLDIHPCNLLLYLASVGGSFEEIFPEIEEDWLDAIRSQDPSRFGTGEHLQPPARLAGPAEDVQRIHLGVDALIVVDKLKRKDFWGTHRLEVTALRHLCRQVSDLNSALKELSTVGILLGKLPRGPFSLDSSKKAIIDQLLTESAADPPR
jgi:hypothetical protein